MTDKVSLIGIDSDPLVYKIGFAGEEIRHVEMRSNGADFFPVTVPERTRFSQTLHFPRAWSEVEFLMNTYLANIKKRLGCGRVELYLSGSTCFRSKVATLMKYKGNRDNKRRPYYYNQLREFLVESHGAIVVEGIEADDILCIRAQEEPGYVIATIDKDLDGAPGAHFKFGSDDKKAEGQAGIYQVCQLEAERFFYQQVLSGDKVDNFVGIPGLGEAGAAKALKKAESPEEMYQIVLKMYREHFGALHEYWHWSAYKDTAAAFSKRELREDADRMLYLTATPEELLLENARLARMLTQRPGSEGFSLWAPPKISLEALRQDAEVLGKSLPPQPADYVPQNTAAPVSEEFDNLQKALLDNPPPPPPAEEKPKRKRRTKAEMEAARKTKAEEKERAAREKAQHEAVTNTGSPPAPAIGEDDTALLQYVVCRGAKDYLVIHPKTGAEVCSQKTLQEALQTVKDAML